MLGLGSGCGGFGVRVQGSGFSGFTVLGPRVFFGFKGFRAFGFKVFFGFSGLEDNSRVRGGAQGCGAGWFTGCFGGFGGLYSPQTPKPKTLDPAESPKSSNPKT